MKEYLEHSITVQTASSLVSGILKRIDTDNGLIYVQEKNVQSLTRILFSHVENLELNDNDPKELNDPAIVEAGEYLEFNEKSEYLFEDKNRYASLFVDMTSEQRKSIIREAYDNYGPSKEEAASIAACYSINFLKNNFFGNKESHSMKIGVIIQKDDWYAQVAFNISRLLMAQGYYPELIMLCSVNCKIVRQLFISKKERQKKKDSLEGSYDLSIVVCDNANILKQESFKSNSTVFIGVPENAKSSSKTYAIFYGPYDVEYKKFGGGLVFVNPGFGKRTLMRMGLDHYPSCGYIVHSK